MNRAAVDNTAEQRIVDEGRHLATDCVIDKGGGEGDEEMKEYAYGCCSLCSLECRWAKRTTGYGLQEPLDTDTKLVFPSHTVPQHREKPHLERFRIQSWYKSPR